MPHPTASVPSYSPPRAGRKPSQLIAVGLVLMALATARGIYLNLATRGRIQPVQAIAVARQRPAAQQKTQKTKKTYELEFAEPTPVRAAGVAWSAQSTTGSTSSWSVHPHQ